MYSIYYPDRSKVAWFEYHRTSTNFLNIRRTVAKFSKQMNIPRKFTEYSRKFLAGPKRRKRNRRRRKILRKKYFYRKKRKRKKVLNSVNEKLKNREKNKNLENFTKTTLNIYFVS